MRARGILTLHAAVFEFVPEHEFGRPDARSLLAHEVEPGQNYHIVVPEHRRGCTAMP